MDISLNSLKDALENHSYTDRVQDFHVAMFVLATPADKDAFNAILADFDESHHLAGDEVLIVAPSIKIDGKFATREQIASSLKDDYLPATNETAVEFQKRQTAESYNLSKHIGLPTESLPCFVFFESLVDPTTFTVIPFGGDSYSRQLRVIMDHLAIRCRWREKAHLKSLGDCLAGQRHRNDEQEKTKSEIEHLEQEIERLTKNLSVNTKPHPKARGNYLRTLTEFKNALASEGLSDEKSDVIFHGFEAERFDEEGIEHFKELRRKNRHSITKDTHVAFDNFFKSACEHLDLPRITSNLSATKEKLSCLRKKLVEDWEEEKAKIESEIIIYETDIATTAVPETVALAELDRAELRRFRDLPENPISVESIGSDRNQVSDQVAELPEPKVAIADTFFNPNANKTIDAVLMTAVRVELDAVLEAMSTPLSESSILRMVDEANKRIYYKGRLGQADVVVTMCRMGYSGRASSLLASHKAITSWNPKFVLMVGIAFGRNATKQQLGDVLVSSQVHIYELQRRGVDKVVHRGASPECGEFLLEAFHNVRDWRFPIEKDNRNSEIRIGPLLSGEKLIDNARFKEDLFEQYPNAIGGEMEAVGLYSAASEKGVEWIVVKGICDWADGTKSDDYQEVAAKASVSLVSHVLSTALANPVKANENGVVSRQVEVAGRLFEKNASIHDGVKNDSNSTSQAEKSNGVVFGLHGIRTHAAWHRTLYELLGNYNWQVRTERWTFGKFSILKFLSPWARSAKVKWFRKVYHLETNDSRVHLDGGKRRPSIVAHSFGTYILGNAMLKYEGLVFDKIVLCGSILPKDFPWDKLIERGQVNLVRNEHGVKDIWVRLVGWFIPDTGPSGFSGFDCRHDRLEQEKFQFEHSEYFDYGHMSGKWLPFLQKQVEGSLSAEIKVPRSKPSYPLGLYFAYSLLLAALFFGGRLIHANKSPDSQPKQTTTTQDSKSLGSQVSNPATHEADANEATLDTTGAMLKDELARRLSGKRLTRNRNVSFDRFEYKLKEIGNGTVEVTVSCRATSKKSKPVRGLTVSFTNVGVDWWFVVKKTDGVLELIDEKLRVREDNIVKGLVDSALSQYVKSIGLRRYSKENVRPN